jgi:hypothetical protein
MGLYADLAKKRAELYDVAVEGRVREWIEGVLGHKLEGASFRESLMDGTVLCELVNTLRPNMIPKIHRSSILMFRRENFGFFQNACLKLGCQETETCVFEDVYDDKNMGLFLVNIIALARNTQYEPGYKGPILPDAARNSGQGAAAPSEPRYLGSSVAEQAALAAHGHKAQAHFVDHGVIQPGDPAAAPGPGGYLGPTAAEQAALAAHGHKAQAHFVDHGIIQPGDPSTALERGPAGYLGPTAAEQAAAHGEAARNAGRYVQHGIVQNPDENPANKPK